MTAPEMSLDQVFQISRLQAEELELKDSQIRHIRTMLDEREQRLEDTYKWSWERTTREAARIKLEELRDMRKEINEIVRWEG